VRTRPTIDGSANCTRERCDAQFLGLLAFSTALLSVRSSHAFEVAVDAQSQLQLYSVRSPFGSPTLSRQRLVHQLALDAQSDPPKLDESKVSWAFHSRLRLDGDYGVSSEERDPNNLAAFIPGLYTSPVDLSYGYFSVTGLLRDTTGIAIGRQILFNELGFWSFDGAKVAFSPAGLFELSGFAGYEQRGGLPFLSTSRYESDGVYRGNRDGMTAPQWPSYLNSSKVAPAFGASLSLTALRGLRARIDYRRVNQSDRVVTVPFADATGRLATFSGSRISSERVGAGAGFDIASRASIDGAWVYDLYRRASQEHRAMGTYRLSDRIRFNAGYQYRLPLFDADSIFNWFGARGNVTSYGSVTYQPVTAFQVTVGGGARWLGIGPRQLLSEALSAGPETGKDGFFRIDSSYFARDFSLGSGTLFESGSGGKRFNSDLWYRRNFLSRKLETLTLVSAGRWENPLFSERAQSSVTYVAGVRLFPGARQELGAEWEHVIAEGPLQRFRIIATATARFP